MGSFYFKVLFLPDGKNNLRENPFSPAGIMLFLYCGFGQDRWFRDGAHKNRLQDSSAHPVGRTTLFSSFRFNKKIKTPPGYGEVFILVGAGGFEPPKHKAADLQSVPIGHSGTPPCCLAHSRALNYYSKTSYKMQAFFQNFFKKIHPAPERAGWRYFSLILPAVSCRRPQYRQHQCHTHGRAGRECRCIQTCPGCLHGQTWRNYALPKPQR